MAGGSILPIVDDTSASYMDYRNRAMRDAQARQMGLRGARPGVPGNSVNKSSLPADLPHPQTVFEYLTGLPDADRVAAINFIAGWQDELSFGLASKFRDVVGLNRDVDEQAKAYGIGEDAGMVTGLAAGGAGVVKAFGKKVVAKAAEREFSDAAASAANETESLGAETATTDADPALAEHGNPNEGLLQRPTGGQTPAATTAEASSDVTTSMEEQVESGDPLSEAGKAVDRQGLTKAGRALEKHGGRPNSVFPKARGNTLAKNAQGQQILDEILNSSNRISYPNKYKGKDIYDLSTGRGARYDATGNLIGFIKL